MSHLGDLLSALVDGELSGTDLDRASAHVAACGACRVEANALRRLKHELHALAEVSDLGDMTRRLLAMDSQAGQQGCARATRRGVGAAGQRAMSRPYSAPPSGRLSGRLTGRRRGRYVLWSTVSLVVVGIGTTAFGMGGNASSPGPQITPQLEVFDFQHAITSGDVPFEDPAFEDPAFEDPAFEDPADVSAHVPVVAATP